MNLWALGGDSTVRAEEPPFFWAASRSARAGTGVTGAAILAGGLRDGREKDRGLLRPNGATGVSEPVRPLTLPQVHWPNTPAQRWFGSREERRMPGCRIFACREEIRMLERKSA